MTSRRITPELARTDPETFKAEVVQHMGTTTELGAYAWNLGMNQGTIKPALFRLNTEGWHSMSSGSGHLILGTEPMSKKAKSDLVFRGEELSYAGEISRRLLHELGHGAFYLARHEPNMTNLNRLAYSVREETDDEEGLAALGSLEYYDMRNDKVIEDITELLTMRLKGKEHFDAYMDLLRNPRYAAVRRAHKITTVQGKDTDYLTEVVNGAVVEALGKDRQ